MTLSSLPVGKLPLLRAALIIAAGLWVYSPAFHGDWLMDDDMAVTINVDVHRPAGLRAIWFELNNLDYFPLKDSVQWLQWQCWRLDTLGYHLTNVALHLFSAMLIWKLLARLGVRQAWLGGLFFAVHPMMVESVAWISELKNTLSLPLLLLAIHALMDYDEGGQWRDYLRSAVFFLAAMLCKSSVVMFPLVILLYAWWRRGQIRRRDLKVNALFFCISLVLGLVTIGFQHARAMAPVPLALEPASLVTESFSERVSCAGLIIAFYIAKFIIPIGLVPIYPRWEIGPREVLGFLLLLLFSLLFCWFWMKRQTWGRHALLGFGFFFINLFPVLGFISMAWMRMTWVSDHLAYLPLIGLIGLGVAAIGDIYERRASWRPCLAGGIAVLVGLLACQSHDYTRIFKDKEAFWSFIVRHNPQFWQGHNNLGLVYTSSGRMPEAIEQFQEVLWMKPNAWIAHTDWGIALVQMGRIQEGISHYQEALRIKPDDEYTQNNWGNAFVELGQYQEAINHYQEALRLDPGNEEAHMNLGVVLTQTGRMAEGIVEYQEALRIDPDYEEAHYNLGIALGEMGRMPEAVDQFQQAMRIKPDDAEVRYNLAVALTQTGRIPEAIEQYREALRIRPQYEAARSNLARLKGTP